MAPPKKAEKGNNTPATLGPVSYSVLVSPHFIFLLTPPLDTKPRLGRPPSQTRLRSANLRVMCNNRSVCPPVPAPARKF